MECGPLNLRMLFLALGAAAAAALFFMFTQTSTSLEFGMFESDYGLTMTVPGAWRDFTEEIRKMLDKACGSG